MNEEFDNKENQEIGEPAGKLKSTMPPVTAAFFALAMVFLLYQFGGAILTLLVFGFDIENADINLLRLLTMGGQVLLILLPSLLFARFVYTDITSVLRVKFPTKKRNWNFYNRISNNIAVTSEFFISAELCYRPNC